MSSHPSPWLETLVDLVSNCIEAHSPMGPLEYRYSAEADITELIIYPTPVELVGGAVDGAVVVAGFSLDLHMLQSAFERVEAMHWQAQGLGSDDLDGPHLSLDISKISAEEFKGVIDILQKMNFDNAFKFSYS